MAEVLKSDPNWSQLPAETPMEVVTLLRRCLEKEQSRRLSSIGDIAITLDEFTHGVIPLSSSQVRSPHSPSNLPKSMVEAFGKWLPQFAVGLLILLIGAVLFRWNPSELKGLNKRGRTASANIAEAAPSAGAAKSKIKSLAVKPLDDFSGDTNNAYLSDGMTEALCAALGNVSALRVPGRSSVMRYKSGQKSIQEMAKELNVDAIVEGSIQRAGTNLLITVQLIDAVTDRHLWSADYKRDLGDFLYCKAK